MTNFDLTKMRSSCHLAAEALREAGKIITSDITTDDINRHVHNFIIRHGGIPAPLNYHGFPKSVCTSVNEIVCHGIPSKYVLKEGDIVNVDVTTIIDGHFGDTNATFLVGECWDSTKRLVTTTREAMIRGIDAIKPGLKLAVVGTAIQEHVEANGFSVVHEFGGHGIGTIFHGDPFVRHFANDGGPILVPGMVFTIEPIVNAGKREVLLNDDGWTVVTADGTLSCQFEHTILVTDEGCEVLTWA